MKVARAAVLASLITVLGAAAGAVFAQGTNPGAYPTRPIRMWQGFAAGGNGDIIARLVAAKISEGLGQNVVVEGRTGAGGNLASELVAKSLPDGYTLILLTGGHAVSAAMYKKLPFEPVAEFSFVSLVNVFPFVIGTSAEGAVKSVREMVEAARREPGKLSFSSVGVGSTQHLAGELFASMAKVQLVHVPYRGGGAPVQDVMTGRVDFLFDTLTPTLPQIRAGKLRAIAVTSRTRIASLPDVPAVGETVPGYEVMSWTGVAAPAKTPPEIVRRLSQEVVKAIAMPDVQKRLSELGAEPRSSTPDEMRVHVESEIAKWRRVVDEAKIERQ